MRYRILSETQDYQFGSGLKDFYIDVPEAVGQAAESRLLLWLGEWFLDVEEGTPYLQGVLGKHTQELANMTIQDRIGGTEGFVQITDYSSQLDSETRFLSVQATIDTVFGPTDIDTSNQRDY